MSLVKFTLRPGDALQVKAEGWEGYVLVEVPEHGHPLLTVNTSNLREKEERFLLTHSTIIWSENPA